MLYYATVKVILRKKSREKERQTDRKKEREGEEEGDYFISKHKVNDDTARISELDIVAQRKISPHGSICAWKLWPNTSKETFKKKRATLMIIRRLKQVTSNGEENIAMSKQSR